MNNYHVLLTRTSTRRLRIDVPADTSNHARQQALNIAGDCGFFAGQEGTPEYGVEEVLLDGTGCDGCDGSGIRPHATHHAGPPPKGFVVIERCDTCCKFPDDLEAAKAWGTGIGAQWQHGNGTVQAIAVAPPAVSLYEFEFSKEQWEEIDSLAIHGLNFESRKLPRALWQAIAMMALGKAQLVEQGRYSMGEEDDDCDFEEWADDLRDIAGTINDFFQPGDGKL